MKQFAAKWLSAMMALLVIVSASVCGAGAVTFKNDIDLQSKSVLLVSMDNGQTVFEKDADRKSVV